MTDYDESISWLEKAIEDRLAYERDFEDYDYEDDDDEEDEADIRANWEDVWYDNVREDWLEYGR